MSTSFTVKSEVNYVSHTFEGIEPVPRRGWRICSCKIQMVAQSDLETMSSTSYHLAGMASMLWVNISLYLYRSAKGVRWMSLVILDVKVVISI